MKLHMYLFIDEIQQIDECILAKYLNVEDAKNNKTSYLLKSDNISQMQLPLTGYQYISFDQVPYWVHDIKDIFKINKLSDTSNVTGFLIFHRMKDKKIICITYGYAHNAINKDKIVPNFGLKVCANIIDPEHLKEIDRKTIIENLSFIKTVYDADISADSLGISLPRDWVKVLAGKCLETDIADFVSGADALDIKANFPFENIEEKCSKILKLYNSKKYKKNFKFLDYIQIEANSSNIQKLNENLIANINSKNKDILLSPSFFIDYGRLKAINLVKSTTIKNEISELEKDIVFDYFFNKGVVVFSDLEIWKIKIEFTDGNVKQDKLYKYLHFETNLDSQKYILNSGFWLKIDNSYFNYLRDEIAKYDKSKVIIMPAFIDSENEGQYNDRVAKLQSWINLDKICFNAADIKDFNNIKSGVEFCDLYDDSNSRAIMIKFYKSSTQSISHLFSQARGSAEIFNFLGKERVFELLKNKYSSKHGSTINFNSGNKTTFVLGIAHPDSESLEKTLPSLAILSIYGTIMEFKRMGHDLHLAKIEKENKEEQ